MKIKQWLFELLRKQSVTDGRTDGRTHGRTDGRTDNVKTVYPLQTKFAGGIKIRAKMIQQMIANDIIVIFFWPWSSKGVAYANFISDLLSVVFAENTNLSG